MMKQRPRRLMHLTVVSVVLGAATTIALAWALAAGPAYGSFLDPLWARGLSNFEFWVCDRQRSWGSERYTSTVLLRAMQYEESESGTELPDWAQLPPPITLGTSGNDHYEVVDGRGWPMIALTYRFSGKGVGTATTGTVKGGIPLPPRNTGAWYDARALPLKPVWDGLLVDAATWGVVWVAVIIGLRSVRGWWRSKQGRCRACGYDLSGAVGVCPECGHGQAAP